MNTRSIQQQRAQFALEKIAQLIEKHPDSAPAFKSYSNALPAMVQMNGIGQALAFAWQKADGTAKEARAWNALFSLVQEWLLTRQKIWGNANNPENVLMALNQGSQAQYQLAQAETQALLAWVKDFSRAQIKGIDQE